MQNGTRNNNENSPDDGSKSNLRDVELNGNENLIHGGGLELPILGHSYKIPEVPESYYESIILDTSLPYIAIYTHLKTHDLKSIERPKTPPILSLLRSKSTEDDVSCKSSQLLSSIAQSNEKNDASMLNFRNYENVTQ